MTRRPDIPEANALDIFREERHARTGHAGLSGSEPVETPSAPFSG